MYFVQLTAQKGEIMENQEKNTKFEFNELTKKQLLKLYQFLKPTVSWVKKIDGKFIELCMEKPTAQELDKIICDTSHSLTYIANNLAVFQLWVGELLGGKPKTSSMKLVKDDGEENG